ncbi:polymorphic toxin-type HINT domain-containing protein [Streptomyces sp. NPDC001941]|uniref:polymorphic toxin-type HINT domain-containing protein n=1 Tax=Streptomyces sp. NPDC001941 TaxID=3154659 RepID=UPI003320E06D
MRTGKTGSGGLPRTRARLLGLRSRGPSRGRAHRQSGQTAVEYLGLVLLVSAIIGALVATGVGQTLTDKVVAQITCLTGGPCETGGEEAAADGPPDAEPPPGADVPVDEVSSPAEPPAPPEKTQAQIEFEAAQQELEAAKNDQRTSEDKAKATALELAEILADELGLKNPFECVMKQELATCGQAVIDVLTGLIGGVAGKFAKKYYKPWDWKKGASKVKKVLELAWDLKGKIGNVFDARGKVKTAEDKFAAAKAKLDAENAKPKPEPPKKPEPSKKPDEPEKPEDDEDEDEACAVPHSFLAGTPVLLADGTRRAIEKIRVGDQVLATDPYTGGTSGRRVVDTIVTRGDKHFTRLALRTADGAATLDATDTHPFWLTDERRWADAGEIGPGARLRAPDGTPVRVSTVDRYTRTRITFDLTVQGLHTYYVGSGTANVLVHNWDWSCGRTLLNEPTNPLAQLAAKLRQLQKVEGGGNVAIYAIEQNGKTTYVAARNEVKGKHSERIINDYLAANKISPDAVVAIYSERQPCTSKPNLCATRLVQFKNAQNSISWSLDPDGPTTQNMNKTKIAQSQDTVRATRKDITETIIWCSGPGQCGPL